MFKSFTVSPHFEKVEAPSLTVKRPLQLRELFILCRSSHRFRLQRLPVGKLAFVLPFRDRVAASGSISVTDEWFVHGRRFLFPGNFSVRSIRLTLLRLHLPLNDKVKITSRGRRPREEAFDHDPRVSPDHSIGRCDGRCVQRAGT